MYYYLSFFVLRWRVYLYRKKKHCKITFKLFSLFFCIFEKFIRIYTKSISTEKTLYYTTCQSHLNLFFCLFLFLEFLKNILGYNNTMNIDMNA